MANTIRIKRRDSGGAIGAPSTLENAELAFNEADDVLYYGKGTGGAGGSATTIEAIGGQGAFVSKNNVNQDIAGTKNFTGTVTAPTQLTSDSSTKVATTAFVKGLGYTASPTTVSGTFTKVTVNASGYVTLGDNLSATDIPTLTASKISDFDTQVRTSRLDQMASPTASVSLNSQKITNLATPTADTDAANKVYVDNLIQGISAKDSVKVATTANITLSGTQTIDDIAVIAGDRVLVKSQTTSSQNGVYVVAAGAWSRTLDCNIWNELISAFVFVEQGTQYSDSGWLCTVDAGGTLGTTSVTWTQFSGAGSVEAGTGLSKDGNTLNVGAGTGIAVAADSVGLTGQALALHNLATNGMVTRTASGTFSARTISTSGNGVSVSNGDGVSGNPTISLTAALSSVGALTPVADRIAYYTNETTAALSTLTSFGRSLIDDADAATAQTTLGLVIGTNVQAYNAKLTTIAGLSSTDGNFIVGNGSTWVVESGSTARTSLGLGTIATQASTAVSITGGSITNLTTFDGITIDGGTF